MPESKRYIGDGVYAIFDGYGIWLHANSPDNPTDKIYLEPGVYQSLLDFVKQLKEDTKDAPASKDNSIG